MPAPLGNENGRKAWYQAMYDVPMKVISTKMPEELIKAMDSCLGEDENRAAFVREAIANEVERRSREVLPHQIDKK